MSNEMKRRQFLKESAMGVSAFAVGLDGGAQEASPAGGARAFPSGSSEERVGRPVRVVSIGFHAGKHPLEWIATQVDREGALGTDIIALPETFRGQNETSAESLDGPTVNTMSRLAKKHRTYIVCPIDRKDGDGRHNSAVLLDREGKVACIYDKIYPVWLPECMDHSVHPGTTVCVHQADFGRVGFAICFDVNWSSIWEQLSNQGAELVIWPSAYSAGRSLQAQAISYNYYIVSATWVPDCLVYDIDGQQLVHDTNNHGDGTNVTRVTLDFDRCIFHQDLNCPEKIGRLLKERGEDVAQEKWLPQEGWFMLKAKRPGVSARELARKYDLEELTHYLNRSRCEIDKCRGWEFS
jgi:predicted amidohydrolase